MKSRRELLKHFGVGALIAPIIGSAPVMDAAAKLIEIPKLEPIKLASVGIPFNTADIISASVTFVDSNGRAVTGQASPVNVLAGNIPYLLPGDDLYMEISLQTPNRSSPQSYFETTRVSGNTVVARF